MNRLKNCNCDIEIQIAYWPSQAVDPGLMAVRAAGAAVATTAGTRAEPVCEPAPRYGKKTISLRIT